MYLLRGVDVVSKFAGEGGGQFVAGILLDGNSPQDPHFGSDLLDLDQLVNRVGTGEADLVLLRPFQITLVLDWVRVDYVLFIGSDAEDSL